MDSYSGLAILSPHPIQSGQAVYLPTRIEDGDRCAQFAVLRMGSLNLLLINTHLSHLKESAYLRILQLEAILSHPTLWDQYDAAFLCGDFNAVPQSPEIQYLLNHGEYTIADTGMQHGAILNAATFPCDRNGQDIGSAKPPMGKRIDYIFSLSPAGAKRPAPRIVDARIVFYKASPEGIYASDHCGVLVAAEFEKG
jgi:endonuclease/exonuclease/phosphatase family metal-dependent hydrolase